MWQQLTCLASLLWPMIIYVMPFQRTQKISKPTLVSNAWKFASPATSARSCIRRWKPWGKRRQLNDGRIAVIKPHKIKLKCSTIKQSRIVRTDNIIHHQYFHFLLYNKEASLQSTMYLCVTNHHLQLPPHNSKSLHAHIMQKTCFTITWKHAIDIHNYVTVYRH